MTAVQEIKGVRDTSFFYTVDGFFFRVNSSASTRVFLNCKEAQCPSRASMPLSVPNRTEDTFRVIVNHNHAPDLLFVRLCHLRRDILQRCREEVTEIKQIFDEECAKVPLEVSREMSFKSLRASMYRARSSNVPVIPQTLREYGEMLTNSSMNQTISNGQFYMVTLHDALGGTCVVFGSPTFIALLPEATELHLDGTFKVRPNVPQSRQLLTIMSMHFNRAYPVFFILMEKKSVDGYRSVLTYIKECAPGLRPQLIVTDFERSLQLSVQEAFPECQVVGCWFHSANAMRKKARSLGLTNVMNENSHAKKAVKMAMALPLLPEGNVQEGLQAIEVYAGQHNILGDMLPFFQYVRSTWIEGVGAQHLSVFGQRRRTNNDQESYHNMLLLKMRRAHPNVWVFTDGLRKIEHSYVHQYESILSGAAPQANARTSSFLANDRRIISASNQLLIRQLNVVEFLHMVSHTIDNVYDPQHGFASDDDDDDEIGAPPPPTLNVEPIAHHPVLERPVRQRRLPLRLRDHDGQPVEGIVPIPDGRHGGERARGRGRGRARGRGGIRGRGRVVVAEVPAAVPVLVNHEIESSHEQVQRLAGIVLEGNGVLAAPGEPVCVACMVHKREYMVTPCNHVVLCSPCTHRHRSGVVNERNVLANHVLCPQCRTKVLNYVKVFV